MKSAECDLLLAFLTTRDHDGDALGSASLTRDWFVSNGLIGAETEVTDDDARAARRFRAAVVALFAENGGGEPDERTAPAIASVTEAAPLVVRVTPGGALELDPAGEGVPRALARFAAMLYLSSATGDLARWKACRKCGWAFYDGSKNRSRVWCDMQLCGSQEKARAYRQRKAGMG